MACKLHIPYLYEINNDAWRCSCGTVRVTAVELAAQGKPFPPKPVYSEVKQ